MLEDNLDVEIDAQRQILQQLEGSEEAMALRQCREAMDQLQSLEWKRGQVRISRGGRDADLSWWDPSKAPTFRSNADVQAVPLSDDLKSILNAQDTDTIEQTVVKLRAAGYSVGTAGDPPSAITSISRKGKEGKTKLSVQRGKVAESSDVRVSYSERHAAADGAFKDQRAQDAQLRSNQKNGPLVREDAVNLRGASWRDELAELVDSGALLASDAGIVQKWGRVIDELRLAGITSLPGVSKNLTSAQNDAFRHRLRELALEAVEAETDGAARKALMMRFMDAQPENGSKGAFFEHVMNRKLVSDVGRAQEGVPALTGEALEEAKTNALQPHPVAFEGAARMRSPDGQLDLGDMDALGLSADEQQVFRGMPSSVYLEHKASDAAFKMGQAVDYLRERHTVYMFPTHGHADSVLKRISDLADEGDSVATEIQEAIDHRILVLTFLDSSNNLAGY